jgi:hypothetical protein
MLYFCHNFLQILKGGTTPPPLPPCDYAFLCTVFISSFMAHAGICPRSIKNNCQKK